MTQKVDLSEAYISSNVHIIRDFSYHSIDRQELVPPLECILPVRYTPGNDSRYVDRRVLLLPSHNVESQPFLRLWKHHNTGVSMAFACGKRCYGCLKEKQKQRWR